MPDTIKVQLNFPHEDWTVQMIAVPREGERLEWDDPKGAGAGRWIVSEVTWSAYADQLGSVYLTLDPADEQTKELMDIQRAAAVQAAINANRTIDAREGGA